MQAQMLEMIKTYLHDANNQKELRELGVLPPLDSDPALAAQQPMVRSEEIVKMGDDDTLQLATGPAQGKIALFYTSTIFLLTAGNKSAPIRPSLAEG